jgi:hypothetical protein
VIVVSDFFGLGAADHEIVQCVVNDFRDEVRLLPRRVATKRISH